MRQLRAGTGLLTGLAIALAGPQVAAADPVPYSLSGNLPARSSSPPTAPDAPFTPLVKKLIAQLLPDTPPTPDQLRNAATILHGIAAVPLVSNSEPCNTIGGNLAPTGTDPAISPLCWADAQGVNIENGSQVRQTTAPPMRAGMASSWDPDLLNAWGKVEGREGRYLGVTGIYAPQADLIRVPNWGRNLTVFSEDPLLAGTLAAAEVNGIQSQGLMAQIKHFAFYDGQNMDEDSQVQDQAAHELYLQPYEYGTSGGGALPNPGDAASMMCSYARFELNAAPNVAGSPPSDMMPPSGALACDHDVKNYVAHQLWKWPGFFASDYFFAMDSTVQAMNSGTDQEMPTNDFFGDPLVVAVESGAVPLQTFKTALARILYEEERFHLLGHADGNSGYLSQSNPIAARDTTNPVPPPDHPTQPGLTAQMKAGDGAVSERASEEGAVLLKNADGALPLSSSDLQKGVLVVGESAEYMPADPGPEQADGYVDRDAVSPLEQLKELAPKGSKVTFMPYMPGASSNTASDGQPVPQSVLSSDGVTIGDGLRRTTGPGAGQIDPQIDYTSVSPQGQLQFGQTYTWTGFINVPATDDYTFRFQFSVPGYAIGLPSGNAAGAVNAPSCSGAGAPTFSIASSPGKAASSVTLSTAPAALSTIPTSPTMSGYTERGLGDCVYHPSSALNPGVYPIQITWTAPAAFAADAYHLREPGSAQPSFRFAYSRAAGDQADAVAAAKQAAKVIVFADCTCVSENGGNAGTVNTLDSGPQKLVDDMVKANPNTIVVANWDVATLMNGLDGVKALLQMWYPGSEGGTATARLLLGQANPSGHVTSTWPAHVSDTIFGYNETKPLYPGDTTGTHDERLNGNGPLIQWTEGDFIGYRFFDREGIKPLFPFGWGLSYTTFKQSSLTVQRSGDGLDVGFDVTNAGSTAGAAVPQVYIGPAPKVPAGVQQADRALAGFARVELGPGQTKHVTIHIGPGNDVDGSGNRPAFQYWDTGKQAWATAPGARQVFVAGADPGGNVTPALTGVTPPVPANGSGSPSGGGKKKRRACPAAKGRLTAHGLGVLRLGMTRKRAERRLRRHSTHGRRGMDFFCLRKSPAIRAGFRHGKIVLLLTANRHYALRGVRPGAPARVVRHRVPHPARRIRIGSSIWYVVRDGANRGVLKIHRGVVQQVGITAGRLMSTRGRARRLLRAFG